MFFVIQVYTRARGWWPHINFFKVHKTLLCRQISFENTKWKRKIFESNLKDTDFSKWRCSTPFWFLKHLRFLYKAWILLILSFFLQRRFLKSIFSKRYFSLQKKFWRNNCGENVFGANGGYPKKELWNSLENFRLLPQKH